jgi:hypothetical protein
MSAACASTPRSEPQGPQLSFEHSLGEGTGDDDGQPEASPSGPTAAAPNARSKTDRSERSEVSDPEPLLLDAQWEYRMAYETGQVRVTSVRRKRFQQPIATARRYGRYAIELWIGRELVDRVRFDFPLVHSETPGGPQAGSQTAISLSAGAHSEQTVLVPASPRATRAVLVDSENGKVLKLAWPPDRPMGPDPSVD